MLVINIIQYGCMLWLISRSLIKYYKPIMKKILNKVVTFGKREWFLLIMVAAITLVIVLFELL